MTTYPEARLFLDSLLQLSVHIESSLGLLSSAVEIAIKFDRPVYDSLLIALADHSGLSAVTSDEPLYRSAHGNYPNITLLRNWTQASP